MTLGEIARSRDKLSDYVRKTKLVRCSDGGFWLEVGWNGTRTLQTWEDTCKLLDEIEAAYGEFNQACKHPDTEAWA